MEYLKSKDILTLSIMLIAAFFGVIAVGKFQEESTPQMQILFEILTFAIIPFVISCLSIIIFDLTNKPLFIKIGKFFFGIGFLILLASVISIYLIYTNIIIDVDSITNYIKITLISLIILAIIYFLFSFIISRKYERVFENKKVRDAIKEFQKIWLSEKSTTEKINSTQDAFFKIFGSSIPYSFQNIQINEYHKVRYNADGLCEHVRIFETVNITKRNLSSRKIRIYGEVDWKTENMKFKAYLLTSYEKELPSEPIFETYNEKIFQINFPEKLKPGETITFKVEYVWPFPLPLQQHRWFGTFVSKPVVDLSLDVEITKVAKIRDIKAYESDEKGKRLLSKLKFSEDNGYYKILWSNAFPKLDATYTLEFEAF